MVKIVQGWSNDCMGTVEPAPVCATSSNPPISQHSTKCSHLDSFFSLRALHKIIGTAATKLWHRAKTFQPMHILQITKAIQIQKLSVCTVSKLFFLWKPILVEKAHSYETIHKLRIPIQLHPSSQTLILEIALHQKYSCVHDKNGVVAGTKLYTDTNGKSFGKIPLSEGTNKKLLVYWKLPCGKQDVFITWGIFDAMAKVKWKITWFCNQSKKLSTFCLTPLSIISFLQNLGHL